MEKRLVMHLMLAVFAAGFLHACDSSSTSKPEIEEYKVDVLDPSGVKIGAVTDSRDNQEYKTVTIGNQVWMAENLNYKYSDSIANSYCYSDDVSFCRKYGRLYTWSESMVRNVCPSGWHLPDNEDWKTLINAVGEMHYAGRYLKAQSGWPEGGSGVDDYKFAVLPAGYRDVDEKFVDEGSFAYFWSATNHDSANALHWSFSDGNEHAARNFDFKKKAFSIRCIKGAIKVSSSSSQSSSSFAKSSSSVQSSSSIRSSNSVQSSSSLNPEIVHGQSVQNYDLSLVVHDTFKDSRDGHVYKIVTIGEQTWMAENLKYEIEENMRDSVKKSLCHQDPDTCAYAGRYYNWYAAMKACPEGWKLPSSWDWKTLVEQVSLTAPWGVLETICSTDTMFVGTNNGKNLYGMNIAVVGNYWSSKDTISFSEKIARFWDSESYSSSHGFVEFDFVNDRYAGRMISRSINTLMSVRCIKR